MLWRKGEAISSFFGSENNTVASRMRPGGRGSSGTHLGLSNAVTRKGAVNETVDNADELSREHQVGANIVDHMEVFFKPTMCQSFGTTDSWVDVHSPRLSPRFAGWKKMQCSHAISPTPPSDPTPSKTNERITVMVAVLELFTLKLKLSVPLAPEFGM